MSTLRHVIAAPILAVTYLATLPMAVVYALTERLEDRRRAHRIH